MGPPSYELIILVTKKLLYVFFVAFSLFERYTSSSFLERTVCLFWIKKSPPCSSSFNMRAFSLLWEKSPVPPPFPDQNLILFQFSLCLHLEESLSLRVVRESRPFNVFHLRWVFFPLSPHISFFALFFCRVPSAIWTGPFPSSGGCSKKTALSASFSPPHHSWNQEGLAPSLNKVFLIPRARTFFLVLFVTCLVLPFYSWLWFGCAFTFLCSSFSQDF